MATPINKIRSIAFIAAITLLAAGCTSNLAETSTLAAQSLSVPLASDMSAKGMRATDPVLIRIFKEESEFEIWKQTSSGQFALLKSYPNCRWTGKLGPKLKHGDGQAPEGFYALTPAGLQAAKRGDGSIDLGFPNRLDAAHGYSGKAEIRSGACTSDGCIAFDKSSAPEIFGIIEAAMANGQSNIQVQVYPFRMTLNNMVKKRTNPNLEFWANLKEGSDTFDLTRQPLTVSYCGGAYQYNAAYRADRPVKPLDACPARVDSEDPVIVAKREKTLEALDFFRDRKIGASSLPNQSH